MADYLRTHLDALVGERHPVTTPAALLQTEQYLMEQFRIFGWEVSTHAFEGLGKTYRNVIAEFPFTRPDHNNMGFEQAGSLPLIIAAHYDTVEGSPGADDNASGLAVLLEVARRVPEVRSIDPVRLIAFCLEEEDLLGSMAYAEQLLGRHQQIRGAIVLECVGYTSSVSGSQKAPPGTPIELPSVGDFLGIVGNQDSAGLVDSFERASHGSVPALKTVSLVVPGQGEMLPDTRRSDHAAFWRYGFPALMLTDTADFRNPHYHQSTDTLETLDLQFIERVADAVTAAAIALIGTS